MKRLNVLATAASLLAAVAAAQPALAQDGPVPAVEAGHTLLTVTAQGSANRTPDMATFSAGVATQGATASEALSANSARMTQVMAALKRAGIADRDIRTSNLNLNPVYSQPKRLPDGSYDDDSRRIVSYEARNTVSVRQRKLADMGRVIDALVSAGANQINGPDFALAEPDAAEDEARNDAMKAARARAELYAKAAGLRVVRILSISESGAVMPMPVMYARRDSIQVTAAAAPPVASGELETSIHLAVQFELAP